MLNPNPLGQEDDVELQVAKDPETTGRAWQQNVLARSTAQTIHSMLKGWTMSL